MEHTSRIPESPALFHQMLVASDGRVLSCHWPFLNVINDCPGIPEIGIEFARHLADSSGSFFYRTSVDGNAISVTWQSLHQSAGFAQLSFAVNGNDEQVHSLFFLSGDDVISDAAAVEAIK